MRTLLFFVFIFLVLLETKAQLVTPRSKILMDSIPVHSHPDSMYAKAIVNISVSPVVETVYTCLKIICTNCDSSRINYISSESIKIAKEQRGLVPLIDEKGKKISTDYKLPVLFTFSKYK